MSQRLGLLLPNQDGAPTPLPDRGRLTIGSSSERAKLVLSAQGVAEVHCIIARTKDGGWAVQDMGSDFGTMLDGERVDVARLRAGQTLLLGSVSISVVALAGEQTSQTSPTPEPPPAKKANSAPTSPPPATAPPTPAAPKRSSEEDFLEIPGYSILETLGRGGMGAVFRARQDRLHRDVALKILSPKLAADTEFVRQFHREAQAAAALNHPNVVTVYDVGEASGTHFLAMEYMDNESLEELVAKEGSLPWKRVAELLVGAARGLVYAESRGIVHRDIKPSNLMLNTSGQVKIADLGLAQHGEDDAGDGRVFGTPHFMAPEQIRGETVDRRSDIYSLGATGYRLLSGYTPFEGINSREILRAALTEEFEPLSSHVGDAPESLTSLIERMIAREAADRPQSAESVVNHLEALLSGSAAPATPQIAQGAEPKSKVGLILAGALVAAGVAVVTLMVGDEDKSLEPNLTPSAAEDQEAVADATAPKQEEDQQPAPALEPTLQQPAQDDDVAQKLFEIEAENELLRLRSSERTLSERQSALLALADKYNGTTAAATAREEAAGIGDVIRMEAEAEAAVKSRREAVLLALTNAANLQANPPRPGDSLRAMATVINQDQLVSDQPFLEQREALRVTVCKVALTQAQSQLERAKALLSELNTEEVQGLLQDLVIRLKLPDLPVEERPLYFDELQRLAREATDLLRNLDQRRDELVTGRERDDVSAIAAACHAEDGLEADLAALSPSSAAERLEALAASLSTEELRVMISSHAADMRAAATALNSLSAELSTWRRNSIADPRPRRSNAEVTAISEAGVEIQGSRGAEQIPWSEFAAHPEALHQLFLRRLNRDWTEEESAGIASLLRNAAVLNALRITREGFDDPSQLKERDLERALSGFESAAEWAKEATARDRLRLEREAATSLTQALSLAAQEQWGSATSTLAHTTSAYAGTVLLLILSDGSSSSGSESSEEPATETGSTAGGLDPAGPSVPSPPGPGGE